MIKTFCAFKNTIKKAKENPHENVCKLHQVREELE